MRTKDTRLVGAVGGALIALGIGRGVEQFVVIPDYLGAGVVLAFVAVGYAIGRVIEAIERIADAQEFACHLAREDEAGGS